MRRKVFVVLVKVINVCGGGVDGMGWESGWEVR